MIQVLLVNEIALINSIITAIFEEEGDIQVIGSATRTESALALVGDCDVVLISIRLPGNSALEITRKIAKEYPAVKVLVIGLAETEEEILHFVEEGAAGYVLKDDSVDSMLKAVRATYNDEAIISPEIATALIERVKQLSQLFTEASGISESIELTPREREVLRLLGQDFSSQEIANQLVIEVGTVKNHVHSILDKLNVSSRQDAATYWSIIANYDKPTSL